MFLLNCPRVRKLSNFSILLALGWLSAAENVAASAAPETKVLLRATKITEGQGGFTGNLEVQDNFGSGAANLGDLNGDGVNDAAVGEIWDDDGGLDRGAVWILFLNPDRTVNASQKISDTAGGFTGGLGNSSYFGASVASIGDLNQDGVPDMLVGAPSAGEAWIVYLNADGTVLTQQKIPDPSPTAVSFGQGVTSLGDLDGDGVIDLAIGAPLDDDGGGGEFSNRGAVYILFLNADGTVRNEQKISTTAGGFTGLLDEMDNFGYAVSSARDVDNDGVTDLAVGAWADGEAEALTGAVWIVFLNSDGTVKGQQKISSAEGNFAGQLDEADFFGVSIASLGDYSGDGVPDLAVGAFGDDDGGGNTGAVYILSLNPDGTVQDSQKISARTTGRNLPLPEDSLFGSSIAFLGDLNDDRRPELLVGAILDSDAALWAGAAWAVSVSRRNR